MKRTGGKTVDTKHDEMLSKTLEAVFKKTLENNLLARVAKGINANTEFNNKLKKADPQDAILDKAKAVKLVAMDVDGVLSDGKIIYQTAHKDSMDVDQVGEIKAFCVQDGLGIQALNKNGIITAIITGRKSAIVARRARELGILHVIQGRDDKAAALRELAKELGLMMHETAYIGDDLPDVGAILQAGLGVSVPNGCDLARLVADCVTTQRGGNGALRELGELILYAQGKYRAYVEQYLPNDLPDNR